MDHIDGTGAASGEVSARLEVRQLGGDEHQVSRHSHNSQVTIPPANKGQLEFHPLADLFPLMRGPEFEELVDDINTHGLREAIVIYDGRILDGRNRYRACTQAGVAPRFANYDGDDPDAFVISANLHRRHLTAEQKRDLIATLLKAMPEKSDRQIAKQVKASPTTVGTVRSKMEATGDVSKLDTRIDSKGRRQPAQKTEKQADDDSYSLRTNAISTAWENATKKQRREFLRSRWIEIMRVRDEIGSITLSRIADEGSEQLADDPHPLDIPAELKRAPA